MFPNKKFYKRTKYREAKGNWRILRNESRGSTWDLKQRIVLHKWDHILFTIL